MEPTNDNRFDPNYAVRVLLDLAHEQSLDLLLQRLLDRVMEQHMAFAQVWLIDKGDLCATCPRRPDCPDQSRCLHLAAAKANSIVPPGKGFRRLAPQVSREPLGAPPIGSVVVSRQQRAVSDLNTKPASPLDPVWMREEGIQGYAVNPISYKEEVLGAIVTGSREAFQEELRPWGILLANQVGAAIANARAFEEVRLAGKRLEQAKQRLEQELAERKEAEERLALLNFALDKVHEAAFLIDKQARLHYVNEEGCRVLGYSREELMHMAVSDIDPDFPIERWAAHWRELQTRRSLLFESRHRTRNGRTFPVEVSANYIEYGGRAYNLGLVRDITERKRAEEALRESQRKYHQLVEQANSIILHWQRDGRIIHLNEFGQRFFGYTDAEIRGRHVVGTIVPDTESRGRDLQKLMENITANPSAFEQNLNENMRRNGDRVWIAWTNKVVLDTHGDVTEILSIGVDITERKRADEALRRSEAYLAEGQRLTHTGSWAWSPITLQPLYFSEEMFRIFGLDPKQGLPTNETFRERLHPEDRDRIYEWLVNLAHRPSEYEHEHRILLPDGTVKHIHALGHPVRDETGKVVEYVGTAIDVTERKQAEEELRKHRENLEEMVRHRTEQLAEAKARAEAANREKSRFLANMSHELRTPLNAVLGFSRLIRSGPDVTPRQQEGLDIIVRSGEHLLNLINNVLDMAKIESGRVVLEESEIDLHQLLHEIQSLMGAGAAEKGLRFALELDPDLPRFVAADAGKLRQVLLNLVGNAIKYTESGGVKLRTRLASMHGSKEAQVRLEIEDSGPGVPKEDHKRIFFPFVQLGEQVPTRAGTGLGLAICKQYVELMGGEIGLASEPGKGSVFYFTIPVTVLPSVPEAKEPKHGRFLGLAEGQPRYRLLIVEDQPENRLLLRRLLEPFGFDLQEAANGREGVALFEQYHPDLVWMDIRMPVMDGLEAVRRIRATKTGAATKIIALTAHALEEERRSILAAGCDDLVRKPFREEEIFDALARHLRLKLLYEKAPELASEPETSGLALAPEQLDALPAELLLELRHAATELDTARTQALIMQVTERNASLGRALNTLATQLDYKGLLKILETGQSQTGETL